MIKVNTFKKRSEEIYANRPKNQGGFAGGAQYLGASFLAGIGGLGEGITDALGALAYDITGQHDKAEELFKNNVVGDWYRSQVEEFNPDGAMNFLGDVTYGLGNSSVLLLNAVPIAGQIATAAYFTSAASQGVSSAAATTGDVGIKEAAYGVTMGAVEGGLEMIGGAAANIGKKAASAVTKGAIKSTAKTAVRKGLTKNILTSAASEFAEEATSEVIDHFAQKLYQIDPDKQFSINDVLYAGTVGAVSGAVMTGTAEGINTAKSARIGASIDKRGNSQTLVNTANMVADKLAAQGTNFEKASDWVTKLRASVDAYNKIKPENIHGAQAHTILGELQQSLYYAETQANVNGVTNKIKGESLENREALAEYVNSTISDGKKYTAEDIANNTDNITQQLAIMQYAGYIIDIDAAMADQQREQEINKSIEDERKAQPAEPAADMNADTAFDAAINRAEETPAHTVPSEPSVADEVLRQDATDIESSEAPINDNIEGIKSKIKAAVDKIAVGGALQELSENNLNEIAQAAQNNIRQGMNETDALSRAVAQHLTEVNELSSGYKMRRRFGNSYLANVKGAIINEIRRNAQSEAEKAAETTKTSKNTETRKSEEAATDEKNAPKAEAKTEAPKQQNKKAEEKSSERKNDSSENKTKAPKVSEAKESLTDEQRAERARKRAEMMLEWEKNNAPTVKEMNTAREYVKGFDNLSPERRQAIIRMIRTAKGVDVKTVKGIANLLAIKAGADLDLRFDPEVSEYGVTVKSGGKTLIVISTKADFKKTVKGTVAHELVHYLENKPGYKTFAEHVMKRVKPEKKKEVEKEVTELYSERYEQIYREEYSKQGLKGAELDKAVTDALNSAEHKAIIESEVVARIVGEALNSDKFLSRYARIGNTDGFIKKAWTFLSSMVKELKNKSDENNDLVDVIMPTIKSMDRLFQMNNAKDGADWDKKYAESDNKVKAFSKVAVSTALYDALDHKDMGDDNLILMSKMPRFIEDKLGITGDFYVYRDHLYENTVSKERAIEEGRPTKRGKKDIHFHDLGEERMIEAIMSINDPVMMIEDKTPDGNPAVFMVLNVLDDDGAPLYASLSFYADRKINGRFEKRPHIVLTISHRPFWSQGGSRDGYAELIAKAVEEKRILSYDKEKGSVLSVIAQHARLGDITEASLNDSISRFKRFVNDFKQKNKINYSLAPKGSQTSGKETAPKVQKQYSIAPKAKPSDPEQPKQRARKSATVVSEYTKRITQEFGLSKADESKIAAELEAIEDAFVSGDPNYFEEFKKRVGNIVNTVMQNGAFEIATDYDELSEFARYMTRKRFRVDKRYRQEMKAEWKDIYKSLRGRIASDKNTQYSHVDTFYEALSKKFPDLFPTDIINIHDQLNQIISVIEETKDLGTSTLAFQNLPGEMQSAITSDVIQRVTSYVSRIESNRDIIQKLKSDVTELASSLKKERSMREKIAKEYAENAKSERAATFSKEDIKLAVSSIEGWTQEEVISLAKGYELKGMTGAKRNDMISQIYIALHEQSAKGESGLGRVAVKALATKIASEYLDSAPITSEEGRSVHLSDIYDEASVDKFKSELADLLYGEFANMGKATTNAEFMAKIRALKERYNKEKLNDLATTKEANNLAYQGKKLRELVENQKRDGAAEDIALVTKQLAAVVDVKGNIRAKIVDTAMMECDRFLEGEQKKLDSEKAFLESNDKKETSALSEYAWTVNPDLKFDVEEYLRMRKGREGSPLTAQEMKLAGEVLHAMKITIERYNKEFVNGHWINAEEAAKISIADLTAAWRDKEYKNGVTKWLDEKVVKGIQENYFYKILTPETVVETVEGFAKNGLLKSLYHSIRVHKQKAEHLAVQIKKPLIEFIDNKENAWTDDNGHKHSFRNKLNKKMISVNGANGVVDLTLGEAIYLLMLTKREAAHAGLLEKGYIAYNDKNQQRATLRLTDIDKTRDNIYNALDNVDLEYLKMAEDFFNKTSSKIKYDADMNIFGYTNIGEGYYVPMIRDRYSRMNGVTDARQSIGSIITVYNKSFNQNLVDNAKGLEGKNIMSIISDHADGLSDYAELYLPLKAFDRIYNRAVVTDDGITSIRSVLNNTVWSGTEQYFKDLFADIQGQRERRDNVVDNLVGKIRSGWVNSVLGANVKVIATQTTSLAAATQVINAKYITQSAYLASPGNIPGLAEIRERAYKYSDIIEARNFDMGALKAQGNVDKVNALGEKTGWGIGWMDERICLAIFHASELQIQAQYGHAVGTEENATLAAKLADEAIYTTQAMSSASERSALQRSTSEIAKMLSMFTSDTVKNLSHLYGNIMKWNAYRLRAKAGDTTYAAEMKDCAKDIAKSARTLAVTGIMLGLITQAFKYLFGRAEEEPEERQEDFYADIAGSTLNILPIASDIIDKLVFDYDMSVNVIDVANDTLESVGSAFKLVGKSASGEYVSTNDAIKASVNVLKSGLNFFGLPVSPVERTVTGLLRIPSPEASYWYKSVFESPAYTTDLKKAVESGDADLAEYVLERLYKDEMAGTYTVPELEEIVRLYTLTDEDGEHYNVLPKKTLRKMDDGTELKAAQRKQFNSIYSQASAKVNELIRSAEYQTLNDEQKAKAIKRIYDLYYNRAAAEVAGKEWSNAQAYSQLTSNYSALFSAQAYKSGLEEYKDERGNVVTVKDQFEEYLKSLNLSEEDYLVVAYANGYKSKKNKKALIEYINSLSLSEDVKKRIAEILDFSYENGKVIEKKDE